MKSPIKDKPLRNPGESLSDEINKVILDEVLSWYLAAAFFITMAVMQWIAWYNQTIPNPILMSVIALCFTGYATYKIIISIKRIKNLKLGLDGEKAVGQFLERLRSSGSQVIHDFPGNNFNIDHIVVHSSGIYAIETKTYSKPDKGEAHIIFNGETIKKLGLEPDRNPVTQAKSNAKWLRELIMEITGKSFIVRPVVLFPGWFITSTAEAKATEVWVLNPKALPSFIENSKTEIADADVHLISSSLTRYTRSTLALKS